MRSPFLLSLIFCSVVFQPGLTPQAKADVSDSPSRAIRLGVSANHLLGPFSSDTNRSGIGVTSAYEFYLNPFFALGVNLDYRFYSGGRSLSQLGYGLLMKHYLKREAAQSFRPYLEYGLLMSVSRQKDVAGAGTAHDTRLTVGADFECFDRKPFFAEISYHYSRLEFFGTEALPLDYLQVGLGTRFTW